MKNKIKILLVEDDPNLGSITSEYLNAKGFDCKWEKDGEAGYQKILKEKFDLFIFDVMMPIKDGFTLAKDVRGIDKKNTHFIFNCKINERRHS
jgi:DNA-binding response OmpR family regulator